MLDLSRLAAQGRSFNAMRAWTPEELDALLALERERGLGRMVAADFIRNGVVTLGAYDEAVDANFKPKTLVQAAEEAEASLKDNDFAVETVPVKVETPVVETPVEEIPVVEAPVEVEAELGAAKEEVKPKKGKK